MISIQFRLLSKLIFAILIVAGSAKFHNLNSLDHYIKHYEIVETQFRIQTHNQQKKSSKKYDIEIKFKCFNETFHLELTQDLSFLRTEIELTFVNSTFPGNVYDPNTRFYEGVLKNTTDSLVLGYIYRDHFCGMIKNGSMVYYLEPESNFFNSSEKYNMRTIIYRNRDFRYPLPLERESQVSKNFMVDKTNSFFKKLHAVSKIVRLINSTAYSNYNEQVTDRNVPKIAKENDPACEIEILSDHTYYNLMGKSFGRVMGNLYLFGKFADLIFKNTDFDDDGTPDNIRISTKKIVVKRSVEDLDYPMSRSEDLVRYINRFSNMVNSYCLSVSVCARMDKHTRGVSYVAIPNHKIPGGICQKPVLNPYVGAMQSKNKAVITALDSRGQVLPMAMTLLTFAHELGHCFGSEHDPEDDPECAPGGDQGHYIMHTEALMDNRPVNHQFSPCSRRNMNQVLTTNGRQCIGKVAEMCASGESSLSGAGFLRWFW